MIVRTLGFDIGISSIGWALVEGQMQDDKIKLERIVDSGVRIFRVAENPKDGKSLALPRRNARSARRRNARRRNRILEIKRYLSKTLDIPFKEIFEEKKLPSIFQTSKNFISPWELRAQGLYRCLDARELTRVILHIAKRRGYDDITYGLEDKEGGKLKGAIQTNQKILQEKNFKTIGEMMYESYYQKPRVGITGQMDNVRNKNQKDKDGKKSIVDYKRCIGRSELRAELEMLLNTQKELGSAYITDDFKKMILGDQNANNKREQEGMVFFQRPLKSFEDKIGKCQFFKDSNRACKFSPSAEEFVAVTKIINTLLNISNKTGIIWENKQEIIEQILQEASNKKTLTYKHLRKILELPQSFTFKDLDYSKADKSENVAFLELKATYQLKKANPHLLQIKQDKIAEILGEEKDWARIESKLKKQNLTTQEIHNIKQANLKFSKHINLSLMALYQILPIMKEGKRYDEAVAILQEKDIFPKITSQKTNLLPPLKDIAKEDSYFDISNPVVNRALSEFRKVINAIIEKYGAVHFCNIELTREVGKKYAERDKEAKQQKENQIINQEALNVLRSYGLSENAKNILKCKLWILQGEQCLYSGDKITQEHLRDEASLDIDHFFPLSRSLDNSQGNKILCFKRENAQKGNKTPYEYLADNTDKWEKYIARVFATRFDKHKKQRLISKNFKDRNIGDRAEFLARNLVDTGYIARVVSCYIDKYLEFLPFEGRKRRVRIVSGSLTSALRAYWGISAKDREHHIHHAQDAIIIACINDSTIQKYSQYLKEKELGYKDSRHKANSLNQADYVTKLALCYPIEDFKNKIADSIAKIFVSHASSHKITGALHQETIRKRESYYKSFGGEEGVKKAIAFGKVREVNGGLVDNGEMVRVDVFRGKKGFYAVPIYTFDFALGKLPNKAIVKTPSGEVLKDWIEMDENYEFCFSLFKNDYVKIQTKEMQNPVIVVYIATDSANSSMSFMHHSGFAFASEDEKSFFIGKKEDKILFSRTNCGIQRLVVFEKMQVSPLGEIKVCKPSKRQEIALKRHKK